MRQCKWKRHPAGWGDQSTIVEFVFTLCDRQMDGNKFSKYKNGKIKNEILEACILLPSSSPAQVGNEKV